MLASPRAEASTVGCAPASHCMALFPLPAEEQYAHLSKVASALEATVRSLSTVHREPSGASHSLAEIIAASRELRRRRVFAVRVGRLPLTWSVRAEAERAVLTHVACQAHSRHVRCARDDAQRGTAHQRPPAVFAHERGAQHSAPSARSCATALAIAARHGGGRRRAAAAILCVPHWAFPPARPGRVL
jgi:hypothetical protein